MPKAKILVVDDSPTDLRLLTGVLERKGYELVTASDGEEALDRAIQEKPGLIFLDIILPKKNGFQVCRQLKTAPDTRGIRIILVSGKNQESDRHWGLKQGADEYLTKPWSEEELLASVARYV